MEIVQHTKKKMQEAVEHLKKDLKSIRTGRANPNLLDSVMVEAYGSSMRLKDLANVTAPETRQLLIAPYSPDMATAIAKAIENSDLGVRASVDGGVIRVMIPALDEKRRQEMAKICRKKGEEGKIGVRNVRREANDAIKKDKEMAEDLKHKFEKQIQEATDQFCKEIDTIVVEKEKEIMEV